jgi:dihydroorotate dehydrogenase electron transfer subunit
MERPRLVEILEIEQEGPAYKTFRFRDKKVAKANPGQFLMIWLPGVDEVPMAVAEIGESCAITAERVGEATERLHKLTLGERIGIRGPYGNGFSLPKEHTNLLFIGGGTGIIPLFSAIKEALRKKQKVTLIQGAKSGNLLVYERKFESMNLSYYRCTDDGSKGYHGFASDLAEKLVEEKSYDLILNCGPELMLKKVAELANKHKIEAQISLERWMKCGIGICGSCVIGEGLRVCKEGPVFDGKVLLGIKDFGKFSRDASGKRVYY